MIHLTTFAALMFLIILLNDQVFAFRSINGLNILKNKLQRSREIVTLYSENENSNDIDSNNNDQNDNRDNLDDDINNNPLLLDPNVLPIELNDELKASFMSYAMSTILGRALPDARDGLKPVHRRVLYAMHGLGLTPESGYRKCARIVGEVLGKYHPHGDQSVYDALVRMTQDFVMLHPFVSGHGNFGSVDNDPAAAMRYTEAKLSKIANEALLSDIKDDTVDFVPNFDGNEIEPLVLPAKLPLLLLNGASGIAVGMATNIPPHNLGELCDAINALIVDPDLSDEKLFELIPAPDFPTGGQIMGAGTIKKLYETGHGSCILRAKTHIDILTTKNKKTGSTRSRNAIIVTELPYMTNKAGLLEKIADLVNNKKIEGITDLRDESDRQGIRVVIELKRDAVPAVVQNNLYKKTALQTSFSGNMLALVDEGKQPMRLSLRNCLELFIQFRFDTLRRRTAFNLKKLESRDHIVQGLLIALEHIDQIIDIMRSSSDPADGKRKISEISTFDLSGDQIDAILGLTLGRLTGLEKDKLQKEHETLTTNIESNRQIMNDDKLVFDIIRKETSELKNNHATPRKSEIIAAEAELSDQDLLANERSVIIVTNSGYIKRMSLKEFEAQSRGGKGKAGTKLADGDDTVVHFFACNDHDSLLFITDKGVAYSKKAFQIPVSSRTAKGVPIPQVLPISSSESVTSIIPVDEFGEDEYLILLTSTGYIKKTPLQAFKTISARGLIIITLGDGDALRWARRCDPDEEILIATRDGFASRIPASGLRATGRTARGVRALNLREGDLMADMDIVAPKLGSKSTTNIDAGVVSATTSTIDDDDDEYVLAVTSRGFGKRVLISEFRTQRRGGKGVTCIKFKEKAGGSRRKVSGNSGNTSPDALSCMRACSAGDEIVLSTSKGNVIRQRVDDLSIQSRSATGVLIQKMLPGDTIINVDVVPPEKEDELK